MVYNNKMKKICDDIFQQLKINLVQIPNKFGPEKVACLK